MTRFGAFGGQYVPESLMNPLKEMDEAFQTAMQDASFMKLTGRNC